MSRTRALARLSSAVLAACLIAACGVRTAPRPPEDTAPKAPSGVSAKRVETGVRLSWGRPDHSVDGERLYDLAGFVVERDAGAGFDRVGEVMVHDNDRMRPQTRFRYLDEDAPADARRYRVYGYTLEGQRGLASDAEVSVDPPEPIRSQQEEENPSHP